MHADSQEGEGGAQARHDDAHLGVRRWRPADGGGELAAPGQGAQVVVVFRNGLHGPEVPDRLRREPDQPLGGDESSHALCGEVRSTDGVTQRMNDLTIAAASQPEGLDLQSRWYVITEEDGYAGLYFEKNRLRVSRLQ